MYNIDTRRCCSDAVKKTVMEIEQLGKDQYLQFVRERLELGTVSLHHPLKKNKLPTFKWAPKATDKSKLQGKVDALKSENWFYGRAYQAVSSNRPAQLNTFLEHEPQNYPPANFLPDGSMRTATKADLLNDCLIPLLTEMPARCPKVSVKLLDGAFVINTLKPGTSLLFSDYIRNIFLPYIERESLDVSRLDVIWDT